MHVLVVDDSPDIRFMLRILLEDAGMDVEEAHSGTVALQRLSGWTPGDPIDAVVLDQRMPDLTGLELARILYDDGAHPPLLLFTAYLHPLQQGEAADLGVTVVDKSELLELVGALRATQVVGRAA
jgi:CheY-like chemotaxis protein